MDDKNLLITGIIQLLLLKDGTFSLIVEINKFEFIPYLGLYKQIPSTVAAQYKYVNISELKCCFYISVYTSNNNRLISLKTAQN